MEHMYSPARTQTKEAANTAQTKQLLTFKFRGVLDRYSIFSETMEAGRKIKQKES